MPNLEEMTEDIRFRMEMLGYLPAEPQKVTLDSELVVVDVPTYHKDGQSLPPIGTAGTTIVRVAEPPKDEFGRTTQLHGILFKSAHGEAAYVFVPPTTPTVRYFAKAN